MGKSAVVAMVLQTLGMLAFLAGFLPTKHAGLEVSTDQDHGSGGLGEDGSTLYLRHFDRVVLVLIDAFRADFLYGSQGPERMPVLYGLTQDGSAFGFVGKAHTPTVTMPRIKAMMSGDIPGYADVMFNLGAVTFRGDNFLSQAKAAGWRIVFYGDDTWTRIFPGHFVRSDPTTSFFVEDYVEVDHNVSRHLDWELARSDWDMMILHYLGLDHIGHLAGPYSTLVAPKLAEMDGVVEKIWMELGERDLMVVCGDHGMSQQGGHGGASHQETSVAMVFASRAFKGGHISTDEIDQVDVAATLSIMTGLPIPHDSIGQAIFPVLSSVLSKRQMLYAMNYNARQVMRVMEQNGAGSVQTDEEYSHGWQLHRQWLRQLERKFDNDTISDLASLHYRHVSGALKSFADMFVRYDKRLMVFGVLLSFFSLLCVTSVPRHHRLDMSTAGELCSLVTLVKYLYSLLPVSSVRLILYAGAVIHSVTLLSSSYIEEEHQTWYYMWATLLMYILFKNYMSGYMVESMCAFLALALHRLLLRNWNQTGDKWTHIPDIGDWLNEPEHKLWLGCAFVVGLCIIAALFVGRDVFESAVFVAGLVAIYVCKEANGRMLIPQVVGSHHGKIEAWAAYVAVATILAHKFSVPSAIKSLVLLTSLLLRPHNVLMHAMNLVQAKLVSRSFRYIVHEPDMLAIAFLWYGHVSFFYQGNSNSLASIDVSAGYVGLQSYVPAVVGFLMVCNTFTGPILCYLLLWDYLLKADKVTTKEVTCACRALARVQTLPTSVYLFMVMLQRHHLFVWTVFAPKLLYQGAQVLLTLVAIILVYFITRK